VAIKCPTLGWLADWHAEETADKLLARLRDRGVSTVVFHCMLSQQRGPFCAGRFLSAVTRADAGAERAHSAKHVIYCISHEHMCWMESIFEDFGAQCEFLLRPTHARRDGVARALKHTLPQMLIR
jgi:hypothetical protein